MQLQSPAFIYCRNGVRPAEEAVLHVGSEAVVRGINVFEGLKGYWHSNGDFGLVALASHFARLQRSARLMHLPFSMSFSAYEAACRALLGALLEPGRDMWLRTTLYLVEGHWGEGDVTDLVITGYHQPRGLPAPIALGVSSWRRADDAAMPCRIKTSSNYFVARMAKIEGRARGFGEMILLNSAGRVAEGLGACLAIVRDGAVITPPASEGALEGITLDLCEALCGQMGVPFLRRPIERSELGIAEEAALIGTLLEITPIKAIDAHVLQPGRIFPELGRRYLQAATGDAPLDAFGLSVFRPRPK